MSYRVTIHSTQHSDSNWMSATDLMSGLMLIFMFIAVAFMISVSSERDDMFDVAKGWAANKDAIYDTLLGEFKNDLPRWHAEIERDSLIVRFKEPKVLFHKGRSALTPRFKEILRDFFPRYIKVLSVFEKSISEIRIEGHTSSEWSWSVTQEEAYFKNMVLSHDRCREVLVFCLSRCKNPLFYDWAKRTIVASGMSSSRHICRNGIEDRKASRRVEFRVRTNADEKLSLILERSKEKVEN